jgi:hypothetical protein
METIMESFTDRINKSKNSLPSDKNILSKTANPMVAANPNNGNGKLRFLLWKEKSRLIDTP